MATLMKLDDNYAIITDREVVYGDERAIILELLNMGLHRQEIVSLLQAVSSAQAVDACVGK